MRILWVLLLGVLLTGSATAAEPKVLGFERMVAAAGSDAVAAGQLLLGELNCTSCHKADASQDKVIDRKAAPVLDWVGSRVKPDYLAKFLADPQATKPGTTMPNVLAHLSGDERGKIVDAIVHFLATTGQIAAANPSRSSVTRGERLFHTIGCVACHDPRGEQPAAPLATSISLGTPSRKFTLPGLTQFLVDPLAVRPGGRMPHLNLTPPEARDIASFLLNDLDIISGLQYAYYEGDWEKLPKFDKLEPKATGEADDFSLKIARRRDHFALRFEGAISIPVEGDYLFLLGSDDGSRLLIDDKVALVSDGIHPYEQKRKKMKMTVGVHPIVVEYFEGSGEQALELDFEGPGQTQQPLATLLTAPTRDKGTAAGAAPFAIDRQKAAQGREYFTTLGCAACHALKIDGQQVEPKNVEPKNTAKQLAALATSGGCLDGQASRVPLYALGERQKATLAAGIAQAKSPAATLPASEVVNRSLVRFNCVACHERGGSGGVLAAKDPFFVSDMPEMGDEGRLPPSLTGGGAKLKHDWLKTVFAEGAKDRPYMLTRMPKFGLANVAALPQALADADRDLVKPAPEFHIAAGDEKKVKAAGRRLVGAQGFSCIKCHTFAGQKSSGIQALSLTTLTRRLNQDWFYHYLQNPAAYRTGTRMPTAFPDGQTTLPSVGDGTVSGQIGAIWNYLADGDKALLPVGLVTGKIELVAFDEPIVYRNFIEGAGPRAIGVGYPEKLNLAFDADQLRLAMLWHGGFIDAARHWTARGAGFEKPLGDNVLKLPEGSPLAVLSSTADAWPDKSTDELGLHFGGYRLNAKRQPTLLYAGAGFQVEDFPRPVGEQDLFAMQRTLTFKADKPIAALYFRAIRAGQIEELASGTYKIDGRWLLKVATGQTPLRRQQGNEWELLIPVAFADQKATLELTYDW